MSIRLLKAMQSATESSRKTLRTRKRVYWLAGFRWNCVQLCGGFLDRSASGSVESISHDGWVRVEMLCSWYDEWNVHVDVNVRLTANHLQLDTLFRYPP